MADSPVITNPYADAAERLKTLTKVMTTMRSCYRADSQGTVWTLNKNKPCTTSRFFCGERLRRSPVALSFALPWTGLTSSISVPVTAPSSTC